MNTKNNYVENDRNTVDAKWNKSISLTSRVFGFIALSLMISVPLVFTIVYGENIDWQKTLVVIGSLMSVFGPVAIAEVFSYYPILGIGGLMLGMITGNLSSLKVPAATSGMNIAEAEVGTPESEVVSILSIAASTAVATTILIIGMIFGAYLMPVLDNPVLAPGFAAVLPALIGGMAFPVITKNGREMIVPAIFTLAMFFILGLAKFNMMKGFIILGAMAVGLIAVRIRIKQEEKNSK